MFRHVYEGLTLMAAVPVDWGLQIAKDLRTMCCRALAGPRRYKGTTLLMMR